MTIVHASPSHDHVTKFGIFSLSQFPDEGRPVDSFDAELEQFELAEQLGYDTIWLAEHLLSPYGAIASTQVLAAAIARRTSTIRIGTAVSHIAFNHPLRTASDFAAVDCFSHGRLNFGVGPSHHEHEFVGLDVPSAHRLEMVTEAIGVILRAWTRPRITHAGKFWSIPGEVQVFPKPVQQPHPPVYYAVLDAESFAVAADTRFYLQLASPASYRRYGEQWIDRLRESLATYEHRVRDAGRDPSAVEHALVVPFFVAATEAEALETFARPLGWMYERLEVSDGGRLGKPTQGNELGIELIRSGAAIASDPDGCVRQLRRLKERLGITEFILWFNPGGVLPGDVKDSMRLAMRDVLPHV